MQRVILRTALLGMALLMLPTLALAQPNITSITPGRTSANTGTNIYIYGTGFGSFSDLVYFPDGTGPHVVNPNGLVSGGIRVRVPQTWSGDVRVQANGTGALSNGMPLEIAFNYLSAKWVEPPFTWFLNANGAPGCTFDDVRVDLIRAYDTWECASGLTTTYGGTTTTSASAYDSENVRHWKSSGWSPGTIAVCSIWYYEGENIVEADIAFNSQHFTWSSSGEAGDMDIQHIATHEQGHSVGLLDLYGDLDIGKTMYGWTSAGATSARTLATDDALGIEFIYPHARANFTAGAPSGWYGAIVPRNTNDGTSTYAPLPATLNGNTTSYINASAINDGNDCASPSGLNHIFLDDSYVAWNSWSGVWGDGNIVAWPNSGLAVRGGRHTVKYSVDVNEETLESSETDNIYWQQFVWSPYNLANHSPVYRGAPPVRGIMVYPNCDGFAMASEGSWWACVGMLPANSADDYDLRLHNEVPTSTNGFDSFEASSAWGAGSSDFVLVNGNNGGGSNITRYVGLNRYSGSTSGAYMQLSRSDGMVTAPGISPVNTIGANDVVKVHEIYFGTATSWDFTLDNQSGTANLGFAIYDKTGTHFSKSSYEVMANSFGGGEDEHFTFTAPAEGYYGVVVFKSSTTDLGKANTYQLSVQLTPPNLKPDAATGWDFPIVMRNDNSASGGNVHVSTYLDGGVNNTYFSLSGINDGPNPSEFNHSRFWLDNVFVQDIYWGQILADQRYQGLNRGPTQVRGGRHMVEWTSDWMDEIPELDETDNTDIRQQVWTPYVLQNQVPLVRSAPPGDGSAEGFPYANCDGFEFTWGGYWGAVGMIPAGYSDYDLTLHDDPVSANNGFDSWVEFSYQVSGLSDFVLVNGNHAGGPTGTRQVAVRDFISSGHNFAIQQSNRVALFSPPYTLADQTMGANDVLKVYEISITSDELGNYLFELDQTSGTANLGFSLFDQSGTYFSKGDYLAEGNSGGDGVDESFTLDITESGYYGLVVWKSGQSDFGKTSNFTLNVNLSPPNLRPHVAAGWDYPVVPRNDNTATNGNAHVSDVLDGNEPTTYLAQVGINEGANPAPFNHTRYYLDGEYVWWVDYNNPIGANLVYYATSSGPLNIRGGRHTIEWVNDWDDLVVEGDETDNSYLRQFVWSPLQMLDEVPLQRSSPPDRGLLDLPNCDGFVHTSPAGRAWVDASVPAGADDDYDLWSYSDYGGAESGFSQMINWSGRTNGRLDYVGGNGLGGGNTRYLGVHAWQPGSTSVYTIDNTDSDPGRVATTLPASWSGETLPLGRLVDVFEVTLSAGVEYQVTLTNGSTQADLVLDAQAPSSIVFDPMTAEVSWNDAAGGGNEGGSFVPEETGRYVFVVQKKGAADRQLAVTYDFAVTSSASPVGEDLIPTSFALRKNAPNPFNPMTVIKYDLPNGDNTVRLEVFDLGGQRIRTLVSEVQPAGHHEVIWDGKNDNGRQVSSGVYFYRLQAGSFHKTEKMTLIK